MADDVELAGDGPSGQARAEVLAVEVFPDRDALLEQLAQAPNIDPVRPEGGYFLLANVSRTGLTADEFAHRVLAEHDVAITPMRGWGADDFGAHEVRFIFTNEPEDRLREAGRRVAAFAQACA